MSKICNSNLKSYISALEIICFFCPLAARLSTQPEAYLEPCRTSQVECFWENRFMLNVWQGSEYDSEHFEFRKPRVWSG